MVERLALAPVGAWNPLCDVKIINARKRDGRRRRHDLPRPVTHRVMMDHARRFPFCLADRRGALRDTKELEPSAAEGLNTLYRRYAGWLDGRLRPHVGADRAADVVHDTYLRAAPYRTSDIRHPKAFLLRIAMNLVRDESRRQRQGRVETDIQGELSEAASQADQLMLKQIILTMPALYRDIFVLNRFGGTARADAAADRRPDRSEGRRAGDPGPQDHLLSRSPVHGPVEAGA